MFILVFATESPYYFLDCRVALSQPYLSGTTRAVSQPVAVYIVSISCLSFLRNSQYSSHVKSHESPSRSCPQFMSENAVW